jgi:hypothetical protein
MSCFCIRASALQKSHIYKAVVVLIHNLQILKNSNVQQKTWKCKMFEIPLV